jgi:hypothetical protein
MTEVPAAKETKTKHTALAAGLAVVAGLLRLFPHPWNFVPMGAIGIFAGARMRGGWAWLVPLLVRAGTDLALSSKYEGYPIFDPFVYGSYVACVLLGRLLTRTSSPWPILGMGVASSILFFLVTNFGAWIQWPHVYPDRSLTGLLEAYEAGIPFYRGTFLGDLLYTPLLFGADAVVVRLLTTKSEQPVPTDA